MDERALAGVKFRGNVTREGNVLMIGPGESFVTGLPNARKGSVAVGVVKLIPNAEQIQAASAPDDAEAKDEQDSFPGVEIYQLAGKYVVNKFRSELHIFPCPRPPFSRIASDSRTTPRTTTRYPRGLPAGQLPQ